VKMDDNPFPRNSAPAMQFNVMRPWVLDAQVIEGGAFTAVELPLEPLVNPSHAICRFPGFPYLGFHASLSSRPLLSAALTQIKSHGQAAPDNLPFLRFLN
jgi:hypothetical protein